MGEAKRKASETKKLIAKYPHCCLCGGIRATATREHFPPTNLFDRFYRPNSVVVPACRECNSGTALADLLAGMISRVGFDSPSEQALKDSRILLQKLNLRRPDMVREMMGLSAVQRKRGLNKLRSLGLDIPVGAKAFAITGEMFQLLQLFIHKAVLCHYFARTKKPLPNTGGVICYLKTKELVAAGEIPDEIFKDFGPVTTLSQGSRHFGKDYQFRDAIGEDGTYAFAGRFRVGFMAIGFAVENMNLLPLGERDGFISPSELLSILKQDRYKWFAERKSAA